MKTVCRVAAFFLLARLSLAADLYDPQDGEKTESSSGKSVAQWIEQFKSARTPDYRIQAATVLAWIGERHDPQIARPEDKSAVGGSHFVSDADMLLLKPMLVEFLSDKATEIRECGLTALSTKSADNKWTLLDADVAKKIITIARTEKENRVRIHAMQIVNRWDRKQAQPFLLNCIKSKREDIDAREAALNLLADCDRADAITLLKSLISEFKDRKDDDDVHLKAKIEKLLDKVQFAQESAIKFEFSR